MFREVESSGLAIPIADNVGRVAYLERLRWNTRNSFRTRLNRPIHSSPKFLCVASLTYREKYVSLISGKKTPESLSRIA